MTDKRVTAFGAILCLLLSGQSALAVEIQEIGQKPAAQSRPAAAPVAAPSQGVTASEFQTTEQRLDKLERSLNNSMLVEMARRQQELQTEVELLRSENEEIRHELESMQTRLRDMYRDMDQRMQGIETRGPAAAVSATQPSAVTAAPAGGSDPIAERKAYERAFKMLREKRFDQAIDGFQRFLQIYPQSDFADNAQYWIGEGHYVTRNYKEAAESFKALLTKYPQSSKVADAYLKLGFTQYELKQNAEARKSLTTVVQQHSKTTAARFAKERLELMDKEGR